MSNSTFNDFGELYRAAFGEPDAERKLALLHSVQKAITAWHDSSYSSGAGGEHCPPAREANLGFFVDRR